MALGPSPDAAGHPVLASPGPASLLPAVFPRSSLPPPSRGRCHHSPSYKGVTDQSPNLRNNGAESASQMYVPLLTAATSVAGMQGAARPAILLPLRIPVLVTWDNVDISKHLCEAFINTCTHAHTPELYMHSHTHTHVLNNPWDDIIVLHCFPSFTNILRSIPLTALQHEAILVLKQSPVSRDVILYLTFRGVSYF